MAEQLGTIKRIPSCCHVAGKKSINIKLTTGRTVETVCFVGNVNKKFKNTVLCTLQVSHTIYKQISDAKSS